MEEKSREGMQEKKKGLHRADLQRNVWTHDLPHILWRVAKNIMPCPTTRLNFYIYTDSKMAPVVGWTLINLYVDGDCNWEDYILNHLLQHRWRDNYIPITTHCNYTDSEAVMVTVKCIYNYFCDHSPGLRSQKNHVCIVAHSHCESITTSCYISNYSTEVLNLQGVYQIKTTTEGENYKLQVL